MATTYLGVDGNNDELEELLFSAASVSMEEALESQQQNAVAAEPLAFQQARRRTQSQRSQRSQRSAHDGLPYSMQTQTLGAQQAEAQTWIGMRWQAVQTAVRDRLRIALVLARFLLPLLLLAATLLRFTVTSTLYLLIFLGLVVTKPIPYDRLGRADWIVRLSALVAGIALLSQFIFQMILVSQSPYGESVVMGSSSQISLAMLGLVRLDQSALSRATALVPDILIFVTSTTACLLRKHLPVITLSEMLTVGGPEKKSSSFSQMLLRWSALLCLFFTGVGWPSLINAVYWIVLMLVFLCWAMHVPMKGPVVKVFVCSVLGYTTVNLVLLHIYQYYSVQIAIPWSEPIIMTVGFIPFNNVTLSDYNLQPYFDFSPWSAYVQLTALFVQMFIFSWLLHAHPRPRDLVVPFRLTHLPRGFLRNLANFFSRVFISFEPVLALITMVAWAFIYPTWPAVLLLFWASIGWYRPNLIISWTSPMLVLYGLGFTIVNLIYDVDYSRSLPENKNWGREYYSNPCLPLGLQTIFTVIFCITYRCSHKRTFNSSNFSTLEEEDTIHDEERQEVPLIYPSGSADQAQGALRRPLLEENYSPYSPETIQQLQPHDGMSTTSQSTDKPLQPRPSHPAAVSTSGDAPRPQMSLWQAISSFKWSRVGSSLQKAVAFVLSRMIIVTMIAVYIVALLQVTVFNAGYVVIMIFMLIFPKLAEPLWPYLLVYASGVVFLQYLWRFFTFGDANVLSQIGLSKLSPLNVAIQVFVVIQLHVYVKAREVSQALSNARAVPAMAGTGDDRDRATSTNTTPGAGDDFRAGAGWTFAAIMHFLKLLIAEYFFVLTYTAMFVAGVAATPSMMRLCYLAMFLSFLSCRCIFAVHVKSIRLLTVIFSVIAGALLTMLYLYQFPLLQQQIADLYPDNAQIVVAIGLEAHSNVHLFVYLLGPTLVFIALVLEIRLWRHPEMMGAAGFFRSRTALITNNDALDMSLVVLEDNESAHDIHAGAEGDSLGNMLSWLAKFRRLLAVQIPFFSMIAVFSLCFVSETCSLFGAWFVMLVVLDALCLGPRLGGWFGYVAAPSVALVTLANAAFQIPIITLQDIQLDPAYKGPISDSAWIGLFKTSNTFVAVAPGVCVMIVLWLRRACERWDRREQAREHRDVYDPLRPIAPFGPTDRSDESFAWCFQSLIRYFFPAYGVQWCMTICTVSAFVHLDFIGLLQIMLVITWCLMSRSAIRKYWSLFTRLHAVMMAVQYGINFYAPPTFQAPFPFENSSNSELQLLRMWLFLPPGQNISVLAADLMLLVFMLIQSRVFRRHDDRKLAEWDFLTKPRSVAGTLTLLLFKGWYWVCLIFAFSVGASDTCLLNFGYIFVSLYSLFSGEYLLLNLVAGRQRINLVLAYNLFVLSVLMIWQLPAVLIDWTSVSSTGLNVAIVLGFGQGMSLTGGQLPGLTLIPAWSKDGILLDVLLFALLLSQKTLFDSRSADRVAMALRAKRRLSHRRALLLAKDQRKKMKEQLILEATCIRATRERVQLLRHKRDTAIAESGGHSTGAETLFDGPEDLVKLHAEAETLAAAFVTSKLADQTHAQLEALRTETAATVATNDVGSSFLNATSIFDDTHLNQVPESTDVEEMLTFDEGPSQETDPLVVPAMVERTSESENGVNAELDDNDEPTELNRGYIASARSFRTESSVPIAIDLTTARRVSSAKEDDAVLGDENAENPNALWFKTKVFWFTYVADPTIFALSSMSREHREALGVEAPQPKRGRTAALLECLGLLFSSYSQWLVYLSIIFTCAVNATVLAVIPAITLLCCMAVCRPQLPSKFFEWMLFYVEFVICAKFLFQLHCWTWDTPSLDSDGSIDAITLVGLACQSSKGYFQALVGYLCVAISILLHRSNLRQIGMWRGQVSELTVARLAAHEDKQRNMDRTFSQHSATTTSQRGVEDDAENEDNDTLSDRSFGTTLGSAELMMGNLKQWILRTMRQWVNPGTTQRKDFYTIMVTADLLSYVLLIFGWSGFQQSTSASITYVFSANDVPLPFVIALLVQALLIVVDRIIYLYRALVAKLVLLWVMVIFVHVWLFFLTPVYISYKPLSSSAILVAWYVFKCLYFIASAMQIRNGYPSRVLVNSLTKSASGFASLMFLIYRSVPFLFELRMITDWSCTRTTLTFTQWMKMEDIWAELYKVRVRRQKEANDNRPFGVQQPPASKCTRGLLGSLTLVILLFLPLILMTLANQTAISVTPLVASVSIGFVGYQPFWEMTATGPSLESLTAAEYANFSSNPLGDAMNVLSYEESDIFNARFTQDSRTLWSATPPNRQSLVDFLNNATAPASLQVNLAVERSPPSALVSSVVSGSYTIDYPHGDPTRTAFVNVLASGNGTVNLFEVYPPAVLVPLSGEISTAIGRSYYLNCSLSYTRLYFNESNSFVTWWSFSQTSPQIIADLSPQTASWPQVLLLSARAANKNWSFVASSGVIGLYVSVVLVISRFLRIAMSNVAFKIVFTDLPSVEAVTMLCLDVYDAREECMFDLEELLFAELIFLYRSPEKLIRWTKRAVKLE